MKCDESIVSIIKQDEDEVRAFEIIPPSASKMAKIIASFANTKGGHLILGYSKEYGIKGVNEEFYLDSVLDKALNKLPEDLTVAYYQDRLEGNVLAAICVEKTNGDILIDGKKYIRTGKKIIEEDIKNEKISVKKFSNTYAIIIAIENYQPKDSNQISSVKYAENDAEVFKNMLINKMNVDEQNIIMFLNEEALQNSIKYDFRGLFHTLTENDRVIFYYVGHGFHNGVTNYLTAYDTHKQHISETSISLRDVFLDPFLKSKCKNALIFIDACATEVQDENTRQILSNIDYSDFQLEENENLYCAAFFSCQAGQSSYSCNDLSHGIWTYHLIEAINGNIPSIVKNQKMITDRSLVDYLGSEVSKYVKKNLGYEQNPKAILDSDSEFLISLID